VTKTDIIEHCKILILQRIAESQKAMLSAQDAANNEEKSSAGDKYETGRAMGHLERDRNAQQAAKAQEELLSLQKIDIKLKHTSVNTGALVSTTQGILFVAIGIGTININDNKVIVLSPLSPLSILIKGKKTGDSYMLNGVKHTIKKIE
jgi:hypothetical protein